MHIRCYNVVAASVATVLLLGFVIQAEAAEDLPDGLFHIDYSSEELNEIHNLLPEYGGLNPSYVSSDTDPNIHLVKDAEVTVTFIDEGAGYQNSMGYFTFDEGNNILSTETIFPNASEEGGGGSLTPGDSLTLGQFGEGSNIGFWLQANGYWDPLGTKYYTIDEYNGDGMRHIAIIPDAVDDQLVLGFEDMWGGGDEDYNDMVFTFSADPFDAIDTSGIATGAPLPGSLGTTLASVAALAMATLWRKSKRRFGAAN